MLEPKRKNGKIVRSMDVISPEYEEQDQKHKACVAAYIQQAFAELRQTGSAADAQIKQVRDDVNGRIARLAAAGKINAAALSPSDGAVNWQGSGIENVTVEGARLRESKDTPKGVGDPASLPAGRRSNWPTPGCRARKSANATVTGRRFTKPEWISVPMAHPSFPARRPGPPARPP